MLTWYLDGKRLTPIEKGETLNNKKIILFGADKKRNEQLFKEINKNDILYIFDNDEKKWGTQQEDILIVEPFKVEDDVILVSGIHDWNAIFNQIRQMGYREIYFFLTEEMERIIGKYISKFSPTVYNNNIYSEATYKYIHFIADEKFFAPVIEYIEYGLDVSEHFFVVYGMNGGNCNDVYGIWDKYRELASTFHNIYLHFDESHRLNLYDWENNKDKLNTILEKSEKIIFHGEFLTQGIYMYFLDRIKLIEKKGVFIPWSGRIGRNPYTTPIIEKILQHARMIPYTFPIDKETIIKYFPLANKAIWLKSSVSYARLTEYVCREKEDTKNILIAHSPYDYTKAKETLEYLTGISGELRIYCVASYGPKEMITEIEKQGRESFGNRFIMIRKYMTYKDYVQFLAQMDIAVFGMEVLSGRDTLELLFWLGKKIYLKPGSEAYRRMEAAGYKINDYYIAKNEIIEGIFDNPESEENHSIADNEFKPEKKLEQWKKLYEYNL